MKWSSDPHLKHVFGFWTLRSLCLLLELRELKEILLLNLSFIFYLKNFTVGFEPPQWLHLDLEKFWSFCIYYWIVKIQGINLQHRYIYNGFWSKYVTSRLSSAWWVSIWSYYFHFAGNCLRKCALTDPQSNYSPLKLPNPYNL